VTLALTRAQFLTIIDSAACLYPADRGPFIGEVLRALEGQLIGDGVVHRVICSVQAHYDHPRPIEAPARWARATPRFERASKRQA
jgi:hypothetical protein